ncbi:LAMI_0D11364g1_1 [Lachancea mirantina]|uniref:DNA polymerase eta n=1 Tax=Lachancea mirantina TaxID=1230905 RepID=A0A1G4JEU3_9SACH|nr:LAMI_0D11364g1_1 [Lachancea mirantina]
MSSYKWSDLVDINSKTRSYTSRLACIAHIDVNAFFAQVEQIRCNYGRDDPVVCVQWSSIIAISYAARKYGITRMDSIQNALKKSDKIIPIHTAVFRKGEDFWQYHDGYGIWNEDSSKHITPEQFKVSLDPYRRESRKILKLVHEYCDLVEKASVDEVFVDLGRLCFYALLFDESISGFGSLRDQFRNGNYELDDYLPPVPLDLSLEYSGLVYGADIDPQSTEVTFKDWDDVIFCLASQKTQEIRDQIEAVLGYTTSCGISRTKTLSKIGSNFKKPAAQTIIRNSMIEDFLDYEGVELTSFWSLGGTTGKEVSQLLSVPQEFPLRYVRDSWPISCEELRQYMKKRLSDMNSSGVTFQTVDEAQISSLADKIFKLVRGDLKTAVNSKPMIKSMMSNKNLRGDSCKHFSDCMAWLEVFSGELNGRIHEMEQEHGMHFVPKTLTVSTRSKTFERHSRSAPMTFNGSHLHSKDILELGTRLIKDLDLKFGQADWYYPLTNVNMSLSNFEIVEAGRSIIDIFGRQAQVTKTDDGIVPDGTTGKASSISPSRASRAVDVINSHFECEPCGKTFENEEAFREHSDYHYALQLEQSYNGAKEDSTSLSYGERRLLFSSTKRAASVATATSKRRKDNISRSSKKGNMDIYKFFSR